jgi:hypothetical protein
VSSRGGKVQHRFGNRVGKRQVKAGGIGSAQLADGAAIDSKIGNRTLDDSTVPTGIVWPDGLAAGVTAWLQALFNNIRFIVSELAKKYARPADGIPKTDLEQGVRTSLGKADSAIQTETDPNVPAWAKAATKPAYTPSEVGAESAFTKNTAFNKSFGTAAGTVAEGDDLVAFPAPGDMVNGIASLGFRSYTTAEAASIFATARQVSGLRPCVFSYQWGESGLPPGAPGAYCVCRITVRQNGSDVEVLCTDLWGRSWFGGWTGDGSQAMGWTGWKKTVSQADTADWVDIPIAVNSQVSWNGNYSFFKYNVVLKQIHLRLSGVLINTYTIGMKIFDYTWPANLPIPSAGGYPLRSITGVDMAGTEGGRQAGGLDLNATSLTAFPYILGQSTGAVPAWDGCRLFGNSLFIVV